MYLFYKALWPNSYLVDNWNQVKCLIADFTVSFQSILQLLSSLEDYDVLVSQVPTWQIDTSFRPSWPFSVNAGTDLNKP